MLNLHCSTIFFFNDTAPTEIYTLSLHDALPIYPAHGQRVPLRLPRGVGRQSRGCLRIDDRRSPGVVHDRGRADGAGHGNQRVSAAIALVTARAARGLDEDLPPLKLALDRKSTRLNSSHTVI